VHRRAFSETFIRQHVAQLPFHVSYAWGAYLGYGLNDKELMPEWIARLPFLGESVLQDKWVATIKQQNIKLVLAEYGPVGVHWLPVCQKAGIPLLVYFHGFDATRGDIVNQYRLKYKELFKFASSIFVVSEPMRELLLTWGAPESKLLLNPCGADLSMFRYQERYNSQQTVLSVGRFSATKRPDLVIKAFAQVLKEVPKAQLRMAGAGEMLKECKALVNKLGLNSQVHFIGVITPEQVMQEMHEANVFVQHSMTTPDGETEGAPVAIMEAGATGLPVVSTIHAGIPEIVEHGKTGYLVPEGDVEGMAQYLIKLLQDGTLAKQMGLAASERIAAHFSVEQNIRILTQTIEKHL
jgi:glycosyltransferase involved in cell wall biosynthesis